MVLSSNNMVKLVVVIIFAALEISLTAGTDRSCRALLRLPNGQIDCTSQSRHTSRCFFSCNTEYRLRADSEAIYCRDGTWLLYPSLREFHFNASCNQVTSRSFGGSTQRKCDNKKCKHAYRGISKKRCEEAKCCWDTKDLKNPCKEEYRQLCEGSYKGFSIIRCLHAENCIYDTSDGKCYQVREQDILSLSSTLTNGGGSSQINSGRTLTLTENTASRNIPTSCSPLPPVANSRARCRTENSCNVFCSPGHHLVGKSSYTCANGAWSPEPNWVCREIRCPMLDEDILTENHNVPTNAALTCTKEWNFNSTCSIVCPPGYESIGDESVRCHSDAKWRGGRFRCVEVPKCRSMQQQWPSVDWNVLQYKCTIAEFQVNTTCEYTCPRNYELIGERTTSCLDEENPFWSTAPPTCQRLCDSNIDLSTGDIIGSTDNFRIVGPIRNGGRGKCRRQGLIEIDFTNLKSFALTFLYDRPSSYHVDLGFPNYNSLYTGIFNSLYGNQYRTGQRSVFGFRHSVRFSFNVTSETVVSSVKRRNSETWSELGSMKIKSMGSHTILQVGMNRMRSEIWHNSGRGLCSVCLWYSEET
ncbi:unnamed protein product [Clavelina lepadiformis]|uniref:Sushi domain-containing protein n=1 Tax=Clavelina lepadiformis TaxID=159417 RepID=A0ABP0GVE6_CLALP